MKPLKVLLALLILITVSCSSDQDVSNFDDTRLLINESSFFAKISSESTISWTAANKSDYQYALRLMPIATNDPTNIIEKFLNDENSLKVDDLRTNSYKINQRLEPNSFYALLVVKYPVDMSFSEFIATVDEEKVNNYYSSWYYQTEGEVSESPGLADGCSSNVCSSGCADGTCPDGSSRKCGCSGNYCFSHLCLAKPDLSKL